MANECTTKILFESTEEGISWLKNLMSEAWKKKNEERTDFLVENFGGEGTTVYERLGTRFVDISDISDDEEGVSMVFISAAYPPDVMIKKIVDEMREKFSDSTRATGKYWDENFNTIGIFECNLYGYMMAEDSLDVDFENPDYWEDEVEPAFDKLEL